MMKTIIFSILMMIGTSGLIKAQDFHASTTKVEYINNSLQLTAKFFTADLEKALGVSAGSKTNFDAKAKAYSAGTLTMKVNGNPVTLSYVGSETSDKSTRLYLKADGLTNIKEIEIKNGMLIDVFSDQQNLVTFDVNGVRKSFTAKKGSDSGKLTF